MRTGGEPVSLLDDEGAHKARHRRGIDTHPKPMTKAMRGDWAKDHRVKDHRANPMRVAGAVEAETARGLSGGRKPTVPVDRHIDL